MDIKPGDIFKTMEDGYVPFWDPGLLKLDNYIGDNELLVIIGPYDASGYWWYVVHWGEQCIISEYTLKTQCHQVY